MHSTQVKSGLHLHVRKGSRVDVPPFLYLGNGWTSCAEIWFVLRDQLANRFMTVEGTVADARAHVRTPFTYLGNGWTRRAEIWCALVCVGEIW